MEVDQPADGAGSRPGESSRRGGIGSRLRHRLVARIRRLWSPSPPLEAQRQRLWTAIETVQVQLETAEDPAADWLIRAEKHLANARKHAAIDDFGSGWTALNAARRESIFGWSDSEAELGAIRVHAEATEKLSSWRRRASDQILVFEDGELAPGMRAGLRERIYGAREVLDVRNDNMYRELGILGNQLRVAAYQLMLGLAALVLIVREDWAQDADRPVLEDWRLLLSIVALGWLAAVMSSVVALGRRDESIRIPAVKRVGLYMALRPLGGAASAVLVVILMQTGLGGTVDLTGSGVFAVAISAGFTELLITRAIGAAANAVERERTPEA